MNNQIRADIEALSGYSLDVFATRFNDGAYDAYKIMDEIQTKYSRFITRDYTKVVLGISPSRFQEYTKQRNKSASSFSKQTA